MKKTILLLFFPFSILFSQNNKTNLIGLWEVTQVTVGEELMTPIARWVNFNPDHSHRGGNGWVQHTIGTWQFNPKDSLLSISTINGVEDPFPPFKVKWEIDDMQWSREEDGQNVRVLWKRIEEIPAAYSDQLIGLWQVADVEADKDSLTGLFAKDVKLFMRMDRRYRIILPTGWKNGVWHAHAHRPEVRLLSDEGDTNDTNWQVHFQHGEMIWECVEGNTCQVRFKRVHRF